MTTGQKRSGRERIRLKRVYEPPAPDDGKRVLVERLWPRGLAKEKAKIDLWLKDIAPSPELRKWFAHDPKKWAEFRTRYRAELRANEAALEELLSLCRKESVTFVFAAADTERNSAAVLKEYVEERLGRERRRPRAK